MIKDSIYQEDTILNLYVPNTNASGYIHSKLSDIQRKSDKCIIIENVNTSLSIKTSNK